MELQDLSEEKARNAGANYQDTSLWHLIAVGGVRYFDMGAAWHFGSGSQVVIH